MNTQDSLLIPDNEYDAIGADVQALGGVKKVAALLWPNKPADTAQSRLRACMSASHDQELGADELFALIGHAARVGAFNVVQLAARTAKGQFVRVEPRTKVERLLERAEAHLNQQQQTARDLRDALEDLKEFELGEGRAR